MDFWQTLAVLVAGGALTQVGAWLTHRHQRQLELEKREHERQLAREKVTHERAQGQEKLEHERRTRLRRETLDAYDRAMKTCGRLEVAFTWKVDLGLRVDEVALQLQDAKAELSLVGSDEVKKQFELMVKAFTRAATKKSGTDDERAAVRREVSLAHDAATKAMRNHIAIIEGAIAQGRALESATNSAEPPAIVGEQATRPELPPKPTEP